MTTFPDIALMRINESFNLYVVYEDCVTPSLTIPAGFPTDFASIPRFLWSILPPHGAAMPPSVLHDFHYTVHPIGDNRLAADREFRENLIAGGISKFQAWVMYSAVRLFGSYRFKNYGKSRKTIRKEKSLNKVKR